ncbi:MAG: hypothetical protein LC808_28355 [Actinobacteria bacterium]|nr:hypothetical protein [Actinomycetota bacterium]
MTDDLTAALDAAGRSIAERFRDVLLTGAQSKDLPPGHYSCGQYLDQKSNTHRGFHGSVAALRVLSESARSDNAPLVQGLILHLEEVLRPPARDTALPGMEARQLGRFNREDVIKQAELLDALRVVPPAWQQTEAFTSEVCQHLLSHRAAGGIGWSYFTDDSKPPAPLPTAFAVAALASYGHNVSADVAYLTDETRTEPAEPQSDVFVQIACLYFLSGLPASIRPRSDVLLDTYQRAWTYVEVLLDFDLEANIEYARPDQRLAGTRERGQHFYVRVPWQLYLIGAAVSLGRPFRKYRIHRRLRSVLAEAGSERGFYYPHSGRRLSSRTYGILFEVVERIGRAQPRSGVAVRAVLAADRTRIALTTTVGRWSLVAVGASALVVATVVLVRSGEDLGEAIAAGIVAEVLAALVLLLLASGRR